VVEGKAPARNRRIGEAETQWEIVADALREKQPIRQPEKIAHRNHCQFGRFNHASEWTSSRSMILTKDLQILQNR
jgi:hypothetical protein